jgi:hypothetical protein
VLRIKIKPCRVGSVCQVLCRVGVGVLGLPWDMTQHVTAPLATKIIADADDTGELAVAHHRYVAHAIASHKVHHAGDTLVRRHSDHAVSHDFLHRYQRGSLAIVRKSTPQATTNIRAPRKIAATDRPLQKCLQMIPLRSLTFHCTSRRLRLEEKRRRRTSPLKRPGLIIGSKMAVNFIVVSGQQNAVVSPHERPFRLLL